MFRLQQRVCQLLLATSLLLPVPAKAAIELLACSHELPPHTYLENGRPSGLATEILQEVARRLQWQLSIRYSNWIRTRAMAEAGQCDLIYTILKKDEYEKAFLYPQETLPERRNVFFVRRDRQLQYGGDLEAFMRQFSIGLYRDKAVSPLFDQLKQTTWARLNSPSESESLMRMLLAGRFDAAIENEETGIYELKKLGGRHLIEVLEPPIYVTPAYIAFSRKGRATGLVEAFSRELGHFKHSRQYTEIVEKYRTIR